MDMNQQPASTVAFASVTPMLNPVPGPSPITLNINGVETQLPVQPWTTLLDALREYLDFTGTKKGCDHGQCGACYGAG